MSGSKGSWGRALAEIQAAGTRAGRARLGACSLEGTRLFERALRSGAELRQVLVGASVLAQPGERERELLAALAEAGVEHQTLPDEVLAEATGGRSLGGFLGLAALPEARALADLLAREPKALLLGAVGLDDPGNVGALVRTAHASGAAALVAVGCTDAFHPRAVRTSMGSIFRLPVLEFSDLGEASKALLEPGVQRWGSVCEGGRSLPTLGPVDGPQAMFLGSEAFGLGAGEHQYFDELVSIPMPAGVDSLSVNAAAAVLLYGLPK
ncbi:MAG: TrmH family RNA methyltransferase [Planctomycetota bacterium]|jgi:TrmH family RNA methyltransferase